MAEIIRSAKSGCVWTRNELRAYNIRVVTEDVATFFGHPQLPQPSVHQAILIHEKYPIDGLPDKDDRIFYDLMKYASLGISKKWESAVSDFTAHLCSMCGYDEPDRVIRHRTNIPFFICGAPVYAETDVCVIDPNTDIILLVHQDKGVPERPVDAEAQLVAEAIAAYQDNNDRLNGMGRTFDRPTIPGIVMVGTMPTFYKIDVTPALVEAVETAKYPAQTTIVHKLVLPIELADGGMSTLDNRGVLLGCFEAFKQFMSH
jgi:hypothetical protein